MKSALASGYHRDLQRIATAEQPFSKWDLFSSFKFLRFDLHQDLSLLAASFPLPLLIYEYRSRFYYCQR